MYPMDVYLMVDAKGSRSSRIIQKECREHIFNEWKQFIISTTYWGKSLDHLSSSQIYNVDYEDGLCIKAYYDISDDYNEHITEFAHNIKTFLNLEKVTITTEGEESNFIHIIFEGDAHEVWYLFYFTAFIVRLYHERSIRVLNLKDLYEEVEQHDEGDVGDIYYEDHERFYLYHYLEYLIRTKSIYRDVFSSGQGILNLWESDCPYTYHYEDDEEEYDDDEEC